MSEFRRRLMMAMVQQGGGGLPAGATPYDYLECDGTNWIMSGVGAGKTTGQVDFDIVFQFYSNTGDWRWAIFGGLASGYYVGIQKMDGSRIRPMCGDATNRVRNNIAYNKLSARVASGVFYFLDGVYNIASSTYRNDLCIFNCMPDENRGVKMRIWSGLEISIDGQIARKYQACTDPNGKAAFYDYISGAYSYGDNSSGNPFSVGNDL